MAYIDRFTFLSIQNVVDQFYKLDGYQSLTFQGSFTFVYGVMAPVFGYVGDRVKRKTLMIAGMVLWCTANAGSAFVNHSNFTLFLSLRNAVTVGQCCFCILSQSIVADMFRGYRRLRIFSFLFLSIPIGAVGFVCGRIIPLVTSFWQYAFLYTFPFLLIFVIGLHMTMIEPIRGKAEKAGKFKNTGICADLKYILTNKTFLLGNFASICLGGVSGFMKKWLSQFVFKVHQSKNPYAKIEEVTGMASLMLSSGGAAGITLQYLLVTRIGQAHESLDVIVAGIMCFCAAFFLYLFVMFHTFNFFSWLFLFLFAATLAGNWAFKLDMIMSAVIPPRRTFAIGLHEFSSQMFGETLGPYVIAMAGGMELTKFEMESIWKQITSIQNVVPIPCALCILAGGTFFLSYFFIHKERQDLIKWAKSTQLEIMTKRVTIAGTPQI